MQTSTFKEVIKIEKIIWKDVVDYEGFYLVSNTGLIKKQTGIVMKPYDNHGYLRIGLSKQGKRKQFLIHRLVAEAFIPNPAGYDQVNHKDLNRKNNDLSNLEWVSGKENVNHSVANQEGRKKYLQEQMSLIGLKYNHLGVKASMKPVVQIDKTTDKIITEFESAREAALKTQSNYKNISQVCNGQRKTHNGYKWKFA